MIVIVTLDLGKLGIGNQSPQKSSSVARQIFTHVKHKGRWFLFCNSATVETGIAKLD